MKKHLIRLGIAALALAFLQLPVPQPDLGCGSPLLTVFAGGNSYHDDMMRRILFSSGRCQSSNVVEAEVYLTMLEYAAYLSIDQAGSKSGDQDKLDFLNNRGVKGIVRRIDEINPENVFFHRSYTHRGWDYSYGSDKANWEERKKILLNTAESVFRFERHYKSSDAGKKREAFCKLIYYNHILEDWYYDDSSTLLHTLNGDAEDIQETQRGLMIAFARANPGKQNTDLFWELSSACETLFASEDRSRNTKYSGFKGKLDKIAADARELEASPGGVNTLDKIQIRNNYEEALIDLMESYIPLLLDDEEFFRDAFPIK